MTSIRGGEIEPDPSVVLKKDSRRGLGTRIPLSLAEKRGKEGRGKTSFLLPGAGVRASVMLKRGGAAKLCDFFSIRCREPYTLAERKGAGYPSSSSHPGKGKERGKNLFSAWYVSERKRKTHAGLFIKNQKGKKKSVLPSLEENSFLPEGGECRLSLQEDERLCLAREE